MLTPHCPFCEPQTQRHVIKEIATGSVNGTSLALGVAWRGNVFLEGQGPTQSWVGAEVGCGRKWIDAVVTLQGG